MSQPLLSIGMIVKNEERSLEKCLNALTPLRQAIPCELIIADTGSTDNTREIASRYADVIFDFEWVNDFSAARNAVIDKATGEWFLTVDADEYLVPDIKELVDFLKGPESKSKTVASVIQRNYKSTQLNGEYVDFNAVRMMKTETGNRYSGRIHEQFYVDDYKSIYILKNTILDHDGYVEITPGDTKKKEKRNLEILESMLKDEPQNIKYIMQCLESSGNNEEKRAYFSAYGMDVLKKGKNTAKFWSVTGPACARQIALFLYVDKNSEFYSWADWCEKNFKDSEFINIDLQYMKLKKYYSDEDYSGVIKTGKEYTKNLTAYKKGVSATHVNFVSPLLYTAEIHVTEANIIVASALIKEKKENEAISVLRKTDIRNLQVNSVNLLFENIYLLGSKTAKELLTNIFAPAFSSSEKLVLSEEVYKLIEKNVYDAFSCDDGNERYKLYEDFQNVIGISVKLADATTKGEAEKYLSEIEDWENVMPLSLKNALLLKADFPDELYYLPLSRISVVSNALSSAAEEITDALTEYYCTEEKLKSIFYVSFFFNVLLTLLFNEAVSLTAQSKRKIINTFATVSEIYLKSYYNEKLLEDEAGVTLLQPLHLFAWYLVKGIKQKESNPLECVKILREALHRIPQAGSIVEFITEEIRAQEEKKEQEQIKNVSPELLAMAEQLKAMLSAFSPDDPQLLAIKQSPLYKQVAFLIEE